MYSRDAFLHLRFFVHWILSLYPQTRPLFRTIFKIRTRAILVNTEQLQWKREIYNGNFFALSIHLASCQTFEFSFSLLTITFLFRRSFKFAILLNCATRQGRMIRVGNFFARTPLSFASDLMTVDAVLFARNRNATERKEISERASGNNKICRENQRGPTFRTWRGQSYHFMQIKAENAWFPRGVPTPLSPSPLTSMSASSTTGTMLDISRRYDSSLWALRFSDLWRNVHVDSTILTGCPRFSRDSLGIMARVTKRVFTSRSGICTPRDHAFLISRTCISTISTMTQHVNEIDR